MSSRGRMRQSLPCFINWSCFHSSLPALLVPVSFVMSVDVFELFAPSMTNFSESVFSSVITETMPNPNFVVYLTRYFSIPTPIVISESEFTSTFPKYLIYSFFVVFSSQSAVLICFDILKRIYFSSMPSSLSYPQFVGFASKSPVSSSTVMSGPVFTSTIHFAGVFSISLSVSLWTVKSSSVLTSTNFTIEVYFSVPFLTVSSSTSSKYTSMFDKFLMMPCFFSSYLFFPMYKWLLVIDRVFSTPDI